MMCHCEPVRTLVWQSPKSREPLAYTHMIGGFLFHLVNCQGTFIPRYCWIGFFHRMFFVYRHPVVL